MTINWLKNIKRVCISCNKEYAPTGIKQIFCKECGIINEKKKEKEYNSSQRCKESRHLYEKTDKAKAKFHRYQLKIRDRSRLRYHLMPENMRKARYYLSNAVRDGKIIRLSFCEKCLRKDWGTKRSMIEGHHYKGYSPEYWLIVQWLCTDCHKEVG